MTPTVIDLSHHNVIQSQGFEALYRAGYRGVINKATEGPGMVDVTYAQRRTACVDAGLEWGGYHFARAGDPIAQADHFLSVAKPDASTLLALDWESAREDKSDTFTCEQAKAFLDRVCAKTGRRPDQVYIYGGNVLKELIKSDEDKAYFGQYRLWLCQYAAKPKLPDAWAGYCIWQYTESGTAPGVTGGIDNNVTLEGFDFQRDWGAEGTNALSPPKPSVVALAAGSRSVRAGVMGLGSICALLRGWWNDLLGTFSIPPADGDSFVSSAQTNIDQAKQVVGWFNINPEQVAILIACGVIGYLVIRRILDKRALA